MNYSVRQYDLLCEGSCNPTMEYVEKRLASEREHGVSDATVRFQRVLRYTAHAALYGNAAKCTTCGHVRRYPTQ